MKMTEEKERVFKELERRGIKPKSWVGDMVIWWNKKGHFVYASRLREYLDLDWLSKDSNINIRVMV